MKILFVLKRSGVAGVETLAARLMNEINSIPGYKAEILFLSRLGEKSFLANLNEKTKVHYLYSLEFLKAEKNWDVIFGLESFGLLVAHWLKKFSKSRCCVGVYHPLEYFWRPEASSYIQNFVRSLFLKVPHKNIVFLNEATCARTSKYLHRDYFAEGNIIPLPISTSTLAGIQRNPQKGKIVSVGRLVDFKTYNVRMIETIAKLRKQGFDIQYEVYGDGPMKEEMMSTAMRLEIANHVIFHGSIPYQELAKVFSEAFCFVGMGTSMLEAAAAGVPSLVAIEDGQEGTSFGFFSEVEGCNLGEKETSVRQIPFEQTIEKLLEMNTSEYHQLSLAHKRKAEKFDISTVVRDYLRVFEQSEQTQTTISYFELQKWTQLYFIAKIGDRLGLKNILTNRYIHRS